MTNYSINNNKDNIKINYKDKLQHTLQYISAYI